MSPDIDEMFLRVRELADPVERAAWLQETCGEDDATRERLERMLADEPASDAYFDQPARFLFGPALLLPAGSGEEPGTLVGRYRLMELIGEGGMGGVYRAEQREPVVRQVALKIIKQGMDTKQVIARFEAERQALATMDHPGIAKVLDGGATGAGRPYFVMELVPGLSITRFCDERRLAITARLELFIAVCHAIQHAHQKGIIHRDLKPGNILVALDDERPAPKVIDFGIAKATSQPVTGAPLLTRLHEFVGTPAYMSPEQADPNTVPDTRSDIYALGVLLYELMTGQTPLEDAVLREAGLEELWRRIRETDPPRPSTRVGALPAEQRAAVAAARQADPARLGAFLRGDLDWIVMKCLEKDRARRYTAASDLAADINRYLHHEPVTARPPSPWYVWRKFTRRHRASVFGTALAAAALLFCLAILLLANRRIREETNEKENALALARTSEEQAKEQLFVSLQSQAEARRHSRRPGQRTDSLAAIEKAARLHADASVRDAAIAALAVPDLRPGPVWQAMGPKDLAIAFDADYRRCARLARDGGLSLRTVPEDHEIQRFQAGAGMPGTLPENALEFSSDGRFLSRIGENQQCQVWQVDREPASLYFTTGRVVAVAFSTGSKLLALAREEPDELALWDLATGQEIRHWPLPRTAYMLAFSPDGRWLGVAPAHAAKEDAVRVYTVAEGTLVAEIPTGGETGQVIAWHPSTTALAISHQRFIEVWDVAARAKLCVLEGHAQQVTGLSFNPGGGLLFSAAWDGAPHLWQPCPAGEWLHFPSGRTSVRFSRTGQYAGVTWSETGQARLLEVFPNPEYQTFPASLGDMTNSFNANNGCTLADGRLLALPSNGVTLRDLAGDGHEVVRLPTGYAHSLTINPAGDSLWVCTTKGLQKWALTPGKDSAGGEVLRIGPQQDVKLSFVPGDAAFDRKGETLALCDSKAETARLYDIRTGLLRDQSFPHPDIAHLALSPDGRWLATGGWHSLQTRLWDTVTGRMLLKSAGGRSLAFFTPDNRKLIIAQCEAFIFYDLATLKETRRFPREAGLFPGWVAFSPDAKCMALETAPGIIEIKEAATGRTVATLKDPHGDLSAWMGFTPDGTGLLTAATYAHAIHRWEGWTIRSSLQKLGLDCEWPDRPPDILHPLKVEVAGPTLWQRIFRRH